MVTVDRPRSRPPVAIHARRPTRCAGWAKGGLAAGLVTDLMHLVAESVTISFFCTGDGRKLATGANCHQRGFYGAA